MPTLRGVEHVGFTVPDLEQATQFFTEVIGCQFVYELPLISDANGTWMVEHLNVDAQAECRIRFFRCGHGPNFEIFEYASPDQNSAQPKNSDVGGHHLAFYVDDFHQALAHLKRKRVRILGEPTIRGQGASAGQTWVYFLTPWGMQLELVSFPGGKGYERDTAMRLWHPACPAD